MPSPIALFESKDQVPQYKVSHFGANACYLLMDQLDVGAADNFVHEWWLGGQLAPPGQPAVTIHTLLASCSAAQPSCLPLPCRLHASAQTPSTCLAPLQERQQKRQKLKEEGAAAAPKVRGLGQWHAAETALLAGACRGKDLCASLCACLLQPVPFLPCNGASGRRRLAPGCPSRTFAVSYWLVFASPTSTCPFHLPCNSRSGR